MAMQVILYFWDQELNYKYILSMANSKNDARKVCLSSAYSLYAYLGTSTSYLFEVGGEGEGCDGIAEGRALYKLHFLAT